MKLRHAKELDELKARQRQEHQNLKMATLGFDYGMSEKIVMSHVAGSLPPGPPPTPESIQKAFDKIKETMNKHVHEAFGIPKEVLEADDIYRRSLKAQGIDNENKHYGMDYTKGPSDWSQSALIVQPNGQNVLIKNIGLGDDSAPKCECGIHKIHGKNASPRMHSTWCPLHGDS
jgi:hypothetical protein